VEDVRYYKIQVSQVLYDVCQGTKETRKPSWTDGQNVGK